MSVEATPVAHLLVDARRRDELLAILDVAREAYGIDYCWLHPADGGQAQGVVMTAAAFRTLREQAGDPLTPLDREDPTC